LEETKALAGIPVDGEINLKRFPSPKSPFEEIADMLGTSAGMVRTMALLGKVLETEPVAEATRALVDDANQKQGRQLRMTPQKTN
jgi:hypothetical protein